MNRGTVVATLAFNSFRHLECYYGVSGMGAILHTVNPRLYLEQLDYIVSLQTRIKGGKRQHAGVGTFGEYDGSLLTVTDVVMCDLLICIRLTMLKMMLF